LPSILLADAGENPDDSAMPKMASDKITASGFMADLLNLLIASRTRILVPERSGGNCPRGDRQAFANGPDIGPT
jgi:hypothetical protein